MPKAKRKKPELRGNVDGARLSTTQAVHLAHLICNNPPVVFDNAQHRIDGGRRRPRTRKGN